MVRGTGRERPSHEGRSALEHHQVQRIHRQNRRETRGRVAGAFDVAGTQAILDEYDRCSIGYDRSIPPGLYE